MVKRLAIFLVAGVFVFALAACNGNGNENEDEGAANGNGTTVEVSMTEMAFDPAEITVPAGEVTFVVTNDGAVIHDFVIEELGVNIVLNPGETGEATVTVEPGTYEIICTKPGHAVAGMVGTLIVE